ncbi:MAG: hypothetical protein IT323_21345 [Anaerolineae bacterium]|nr:hypothetical protein [Anaerolineae bacterium]
MPIEFLERDTHLQECLGVGRHFEVNNAPGVQVEDDLGENRPGEALLVHGIRRVPVARHFLDALCAQPQHFVDLEVRAQPGLKAGNLALVFCHLGLVLVESDARFLEQVVEPLADLVQIGDLPLDFSFPAILFARLVGTEGGKPLGHDWHKLRLGGQEAHQANDLALNDFDTYGAVAGPAGRILLVAVAPLLDDSLSGECVA